MNPPTTGSRDDTSPGTGSPAISRHRVRACANLAAIAERRRARTAGQQARRRAEHRREAHQYRDHLPLFDADFAAVDELAHGHRRFATHTGPPAPTDAEKPHGEEARRIQRHERSRLRATYDAERWLAIWALRRSGTGGPTIAALLHISERQVERWTQRPTVGWPHGLDAVLLPRTGASAVQDTSDTRALVRAPTSPRHPGRGPPPSRAAPPSARPQQTSRPSPRLKKPPHEEEPALRQAPGRPTRRRSLVGTGGGALASI